MAESDSNAPKNETAKGDKPAAAETPKFTSAYGDPRVDADALQREDESREDYLRRLNNWAMVRPSQLPR